MIGWRSPATLRGPAQGFVVDGSVGEGATLPVIVVVVDSGAVGCSATPPTSMCQQTGTPNTGGVETFQIAGDVLTVTMRVAQYCPASIGVRAVVSVQDPANSRLPLAEGDETSDVLDRNQSNGMSTTVKVQSTLPGSYHFTARFEPNLGVVQTDILVAENHRDAGAAFSATSTLTNSGSPWSGMDTVSPVISQRSPV